MTTAPPLGWFVHLIVGFPTEFSYVPYANINIPSGLPTSFCLQMFVKLILYTPLSSNINNNFTTTLTAYVTP